MDSQSQAYALRYEWDLLRSPQFLPVLQRLARLPILSDTDLEVSFSDRQQLKGVALKRWFELDPVGAKREIVTQIGSASPSLSVDSIGFLSKERFPQFEPLWAHALLNTTDSLRERNLGALLVRFGTGDVIADMIAKLDSKSKSSCDGHVVALAYLVRFDPDRARQMLKQEIPGQCSDRLKHISELATSPVLNDQAVENLDSTDLETVRDAIQYLSDYGRKEDEVPLWRRYAEWAAVYDGKPDRLNLPGNDAGKTYERSIVGEELGNALIRGQGWFADPELLASVQKKCVGERMCSQLKDEAARAAAPYKLLLIIEAGRRTSDYIGVAQYGTSSLELFEAKISQFPAGSKFVMDRYPPSQNDEWNLKERRLETAVQAILKKQGMFLEITQH